MPLWIRIGEPMAERKTQLPFPTPTSPLVDGIEVAVRESTERWTDIVLEDGTSLRLKPSVLSAVRIIGQYDPEGNPVYALRAGQIMIVASAPENLKQPKPGTKVH
jgi:hypothetical protein